MAYSPPPARKDECIAVIEKAVADLKPGETIDRAAICKQFPEIDYTNIYRWSKRVENGTPSNRDLNATAREIQTRAEAGVIDHLPAVPAPAAIAADGGAKLRRLDFAAEIPKLYSDAEMLRQFSVIERDVDGVPMEKIKNPVAFEKSIRARASLIETSLKVLQEVWDMRMMQQFNELIIEEIGLEAPDCKRRILQRLAALNQRNGINLHGMRV